MNSSVMVVLLVTHFFHRLHLVFERFVKIYRLGEGHVNRIRVNYFWVIEISHCVWLVKWEKYVLCMVWDYRLSCNASGTAQQEFRLVYFNRLGEKEVCFCCSSVWCFSGPIPTRHYSNSVSTATSPRSFVGVVDSNSG